MPTDSQKIAAAIASLDPAQTARYQQALKEGYKDEVCPRCGGVHLACDHFIRCGFEDCPMKSRDGAGHASTLLEMMERANSAKPPVSRPD